MTGAARSLPSGPGPQASTGFWLRQAAAAWQRELGRRLRPLGVTPAQFFVVSAAGWLQATTGELPTQQQVSELAGTDRMMTSKVVATLEDRGLLMSEADPDNARLKRLRQTDAGRQLTTEALVAVRELEEQFFTGLPGRLNTQRLRTALDEIAHRE